jgi:hypothetical protein
MHGYDSHHLPSHHIPMSGQQSLPCQCSHLRTGNNNNNSNRNNDYYLHSCHYQQHHYSIILICARIARHVNIQLCLSFLIIWDTLFKTYFGFYLLSEFMKTILDSDHCPSLLKLLCIGSWFRFHFPKCSRFNKYGRWKKSEIIVLNTFLYITLLTQWIFHLMLQNLLAPIWFSFSVSSSP